MTKETENWILVSTLFGIPYFLFMLLPLFKWMSLFDGVYITGMTLGSFIILWDIFHGRT